MSLKAFHIFFIAVSTICALGFGTWAADDYARSGNGVSLALAIGAFLAAALLVWYATWFLKKLKNVGYLAALMLLGARAAEACAVCNGAPNAPLTQGAKAGVLVLVGVVGTVLGGIASVAVFWARRARALEAAAQAAAPAPVERVPERETTLV